VPFARFHHGCVPSAADLSHTHNKSLYCASCQLSVIAGFVCNAVIAGDGSLQTAMKESFEELGIQFPAEVCHSILGTAALLPATLAFHLKHASC
jgi:hypothetical protein